MISRGQSIQKSDLDSLAYLANTMLPNGFHKISASGADRSFAFNESSGWKTELGRIRANLFDWYKSKLADVVLPASPFYASELFNCCVSGPWVFVPWETGFTPSRSRRFFMVWESAAYSQLLTARFDEVTLYSLSPGDVFVKYSNNRFSEPTIQEFHFEETNALLDGPAYKTQVFNITDFITFPGDSYLYLEATCDFWAVAKSLPVENLQCNPLMNANNSQVLFPDVSIVGPDGGTGYNQQMPSPHYDITPKRGGGDDCARVDEWRMQCYPCAKSANKATANIFTVTEFLHPNAHPTATISTESIYGSMIYSITARRGAVSYNGYNIAAIGDEKLKVEFGTLVGSSFRKLAEAEIPAGAFDVTIYPQGLLILGNQPLYYKCSEDAFVTTTISCAHDVVSTDSPTNWHHAYWSFTPRISFPIIADFYNDTEQLLQNIRL